MLIALIGPPGSGKTSIGSRLARRFGFKWLDMDDDILEPSWSCSVTDKLASVGDERFVIEEGECLRNADLPECNTVLSLSGSNPMYEPAMKRLEDLETIFVFLDVHIDDVLGRLEDMKVGRIVGQATQNMKDILEFRRTFYLKHYDVRIYPPRGADLNVIEDLALHELERFWNRSMAEFASTRNDEVTASFRQVILGGLAPDRGLFVPTSKLPKFSARQLRRMAELPYVDTAKLVMEKLTHPSQIRPQILHSMIDEAYSSFHDSKIVPVISLNENMFLSELFHGPTASFKDLALQLLPRLIEGLLQPDDRYLFIVATSGDTGSAVLEGFGAAEARNLAVVVMYPTNGISEIQKQQMVSFKADNVSVVGIEGNFDDCQRIVKALFLEQKVVQEFKNELGVKFNTANSINWGRIMPQIVYHIHTYAQLVSEGVIEAGQGIDVCVPSGNFGNIFSASLAREMGVPIEKLLCASNSNKILTDFFSTGRYDLRDRPLEKTMSPAIDILVSSNLERFIRRFVSDKRTNDLFVQLANERFFELSADEFKLLEKEIRANWCTEDDCAATIRKLHLDEGYLTDPHTAVGLKVAEEQLTERPMVVMSTAHYSKFWMDVGEIIGSDALLGQFNHSKPPQHKAVIECLEKTVEHKIVMRPDLQEMVTYLKSFCTKYFGMHI